MNREASALYHRTICCMVRLLQMPSQPDQTPHALQALQLVTEGWKKGVQGRLHQRCLQGLASTSGSVSLLALLRDCRVSALQGLKDITEARSFCYG
jgi:hypothetical protein